MLIENIHCNVSGGCAIGSLGADTAISKITYNNIYSWQSNQMFMIKSNGGSGEFSSLVLLFPFLIKVFQDRYLTVYSQISLATVMHILSTSTHIGNQRQQLATVFYIPVSPSLTGKELVQMVP